MLITLGMTSLLFCWAWGWFGNGVNRARFFGYIARVLNIPTQIANVISYYLLYTFAGLAVVSILVFICLALDFQSGATFILMLSGAVLLVITFPFSGIVMGLKNGLTELEKEISELVKEVTEPAAPGTAVWEALETIKSELMALFDPGTVAKMLARPPRIIIRTVSGIIKALDKLFGLMLSLTLWVMIIGYGMMYLPEGFLLGNVIAVILGLGLVLAINLKKGCETRAWQKARFWINTAVTVGITSIVIGGIKLAWPELDLATTVAAAGARDEVVSGLFGQKYDQIPLQVKTRDLAYILDNRGRRVRAVTIYPTEKFWRVVDEKMQVLKDGRRYWVCLPEHPNLDGVPNADKRLLVPKAATSKI